MEINMKKILFTLVILATLILSACASTSSSSSGSVSSSSSGSVSTDNTDSSTSTSSSANQTGSGTAQLNSDYENAVPVAMQLLLGTYQLDGTDQAVTAEQASKLLPLWNEYKTLSMSNMPAQGSASPMQGGTPEAPQGMDAETQAQLDALLTQIQAAMTPAQIEAIAAMQITQDKAMSLMQQMGMPSGGPPAANGSAPGSGGQPPAGAQASGAPPAGTPPAGGQLPNPPSGGAGMFPPGAIDALIQQLQNISTGQSSSSTLSTQSGNPAASNTSSGTSSTSAAFSLESGSQSLSGQSFSASATDESGVYVTGGASLALTQSTITTSGDSSSSDDSSFHGLNAAVLANSSSKIVLSNSTVTSSGSGANGVFAEGSGTQIDLTDVKISATGQYAHAVMATNGGALTLTNVDMSTAGANSGAIATDRGGGTIRVTGGSVTTSGADSPGIYSTGDIAVAQANISASGSEAAVIEGSNTITVTDTNLSGSKKWGVMIYQSMSGDAQGAEGSFSMSGGSLSAAVGPLFYVTNSTGNISLTGVQTTAVSGTLIEAGAGNWGTSGSNGGTVHFSANAQTLSGDVVADSLSTVSIDLQNGSTLSGAINNANTAQAANLSLDGSSTWTVTADSYLTCLSDADGISGTTITNINGNGNTVYYNANACPNLGGRTYSLSGGGELVPGG
jgi:uncharacterized protein YcfL